MSTITTAPKYAVFDEVTLNGDRLCFYFKFTLEQGIIYAAKQQIGTTVTSIKDTPLIRVFEWLGFSSLASELLQSPKFASRFKPQINNIIDNKLNVLTINGEAFYMVNNGDEWSAYKSVFEHPYLQELEIQTAISNILGRDFISKQNKQIELDEKINNHFQQSINDVRKFNQDLADGKFTKSEDSSEKNIITNINETTCSVIC